METAAFLLGCGFLYYRYDPVPPLVISWALFAIASKQRDAAAVVGASLPLASILTIFSLFVIYFRIKRFCCRSKMNRGDRVFE